MANVQAFCRIFEKSSSLFEKTASPISGRLFCGRYAGIKCGAWLGTLLGGAWLAGEGPDAASPAGGVSGMGLVSLWSAFGYSREDTGAPD